MINHNDRVHIDLRGQKSHIHFDGKCWPSETTFVFTVSEKYGMSTMWVCNNWRKHGTIKSLVDTYWGYDTSEAFDLHSIYPYERADQ